MNRGIKYNSLPTNRDFAKWLLNGGWPLHRGRTALVLTFKALHVLAPQYISVFVKLKERLHYNLRSCAELLLMPPGAITRKTLGYRAFASFSKFRVP